MWNQLKALLNFDAFCRACETYHELLVEMGLAPPVPVANGTLLTDQSVSEPPISPIHVTDMYAMKTARNIPGSVAIIPSTHNIYHLN